jgi:hypothetical protein
MDHFLYHLTSVVWVEEILVNHKRNNDDDIKSNRYLSTLSLKRATGRGGYVSPRSIYVLDRVKRIKQHLLTRVPERVHHSSSAPRSISAS